MEGRLQRYPYWSQARIRWKSLQQQWKGETSFFEWGQIVLTLKYLCDFLKFSQELYQTVVGDRLLHLESPTKAVKWGETATTVGVYRGNLVVIRKVNKKSVDMNRTILKELNAVRIKLYSKYSNYIIEIELIYLLTNRRQLIKNSLLL